MATLALTENEIISIRRQLNDKWTTEDLSDESIQDDLVISSATDYVFEKCLEALNPRLIPDSTEREIAMRVRDSMPEDLDDFVNIVLKPPQPAQFRRAVLFRAAGILVPGIREVVSESAGGIAQRLLYQQWEIKQATLFARCDEEINLIINAFPEDAFKAPLSSQRTRINMFTASTPFVLNNPVVIVVDEG